MRWAAQQLKPTCMASHGHRGGYSDGIQTIMAVEQVGLNRTYRIAEHEIVSPPRSTGNPRTYIRVGHTLSALNLAQSTVVSSAPSESANKGQNSTSGQSSAMNDDCQMR